MGKIYEIFNFDNIGGKIKNLAKWSCWITILLIWIAAPIAFIVLVADDWTAYLWWIPIASAVVGPVVVWIDSWAMYAFGEFVEDTHAMRKKYYPMAEEQANREAEEKANREAKEIAQKKAQTSQNKKRTIQPEQDWLKKAAQQTISASTKHCPYCGERVTSDRCEMCGKEIKF